MLNIENIKNALYIWVNGITVNKVIFAYPNAPRPTGDYILINIIQSMPVGIEESISVLLSDDSIDVDYSNIEELFVSINTYGTNAYQIATKIKDSLARITVKDQLFAAGLGHLKTSVVRNIPEILNKIFEQRSQFDCFFSVRSSDEENIETIKKVEITNNLDDYTIII